VKFSLVSLCVLLQLLRLPVLQGLGVTYGSYEMPPVPAVLGVVQDGKIRQVGSSISYFYFS
jgi:hypothetical protein